MTIGEKIHALRIQHNMTMDDLASELGVQRSAINKYEKGIVVNLKRSTIAGLCRVFGVSSAYFLDDDNHLEMDLQLFADRNLSYEEQNLVTVYRSLSPRGQQLLTDRAEELKLLYGKKSEGFPNLPFQVKP